ncbi:hypothetical protein NLG97_g4938 [Lecanicillium saksenae]|uniref:Uncharacterized protein n=1 Tax=Lecanicillium saksenae TaxID=468837 RepID=A0ACC1QV24_9HYPO|nr:hypothetical protein NLG97_g4938 [Lecanicillium saksenae]
MVGSSKNHTSDLDDDGPTRRLCTWISAFKLTDAPEDLQTRAKYLLLDGIGCALLGARLPWSEKAAKCLFDLEPLEGGTAEVIGYDHRTTPLTAALVNSTFIQGFELDDWHIEAPLHSNSLIIPVLLAIAAHVGSRPDGAAFRGDELLTSYLVGIEVGPRVGLGLHGTHMLSMGWHSGAVFGPSAAAASACKLLGLEADAIEDALGIACTQAGGLMSAQFESESKRMQHGFAARSGLLAAMLAKAGYVGIKRVFEREYGGFLKQFSSGNGMEPQYLPEEVARDLGKEWKIHGMAVKPYASMAGTHNTVDCISDMRRKYPQLLPEDCGNIKRILVELGKPAFEHGGWKPTRPLTTTGAQMSNAYVAAAFLVDNENMARQYAPQNLDRDEVWSLIEIIDCELNESLKMLGTRVTIWFKDQKEPISCQRDAATGVLPPLTNEQILAKWQNLMENVIDGDRRAKIENVVLHMEDCQDVRVLGELLGGTCNSPIA